METARTEASPSDNHLQIGDIACTDGGRSRQGGLRRTAQGLVAEPEMSDEAFGYTLRDGISFCMIDERPIFLDLPRDRYFCLSRSAERSFVDLITGATVSRDAKIRLLSSDLFIPTLDAALPAPCPALSNSGESLLDADRGPWDSLEVMRAFAALARTRLTLRWRGLERLLAAFTRRKAHPLLASPSARATVIASAFVRTRYLVTAHDRCLVRSLAIARRMVTAGLSADLVLGVKLDPFKAHCWVQHEGAIVNDRWDAIREFTPILVL